MQDVVIVPTYDRPELLWLCLDYLAASPESTRVSVWVYVDAHIAQKPPPRDEIIEVVKKFPRLTIELVFRPQHGYSGNSFNVLMAYQEAYRSQARYVFLVEDDVLIHPAFFALHRQQHTRRQLGCSIAVAKGPKQGPYASLGVCFRREALQLVMPHCCDEYFGNMRGYIRQKFPHHKKLDYEQDGLMARVLEGRLVLWAQQPLAQHVGWYGYHRRQSTRPQGTLTQRYEQVKRVLKDKDLLRRWQRDFGDIQPVI